MGDCVGELFYGVQLKDKEWNRILEANGDNYDLADGLKLEQPYENEEHFVIVKESGSAAYNSSRLLSADALVVKEGWKERLKAFCEKEGLPFEPPPDPNAKRGDREIGMVGWWLTGHYN